MTIRDADPLHRPRPLPCPRRGMSLLEVMIAMVIFALVMSSMYLTFRTGVKAYQIGLTHSDGDQLVRYVFGQITDDLRNVYYKKPIDYNVTRRQREAMAAERERQALQSGSKITAGEDPNAPELGPKIDLNFRSTGSGDASDLTFVRYQTLKRGEDRKPWGLERLRYYVSNNMLLRSVDDVKAPETDEDGNEIPKPNPPQVDKLAANVKSFALKFGYWFDGEWQTTADWDSSVEKYRNPASEDEEDQAALDAMGLQNAAYMNNQQKTKKTDDIPAWVEITITFTDPKNTEKERVLRQVLLMPTSQETYVPPEMDGREPARSGGSRDRDRGSGRGGRR